MGQRGRPTAQIVLGDDEGETLERWARRTEDRSGVGVAMPDRARPRSRFDESGDRKEAESNPVTDLSHWDDGGTPCRLRIMWIALG